jgi:hypothetical protein
LEKIASSIRFATHLLSLKSIFLAATYAPFTEQFPDLGKLIEDHVHIALNDLIEALDGDEKPKG